MRLFTSLFGLSHLTVRAPALVGAAIYISAACIFCRLLSSHTRLQWLVFVCLVYNPFIFDHLVAARGYSLAMAFLMAALVLAAWAQHPESRAEPRWPAERIGAACSVCLALSFAANFSFAFVDAAALLAIFVWLCGLRRGARERLRLWAACTLPGLAVTLFLTASVLIHFSKTELHFGAWSLGEMWGSVQRDSLYELNPQIVNPLLLRVAERLKRFLFPVLLTFALWRAAAAVSRRRVAQDVHTMWLRSLGAVLAAISALALLAHWLAFRRFRLLLPMDRTALFLALLGTMLVAVAAALPGGSHDWGLRGLTGMLFVVSFYFLGCLRLGYFKEWRWDADVDKVYPVLAYYNRTYGVREVVSEWKYNSALRFYHLLDGHDTISGIRYSIQIPDDGQVYVLDWGFQEDTIRRLGLRVVYRAPSTDVVVAIRAGLEARATAIN
jgi:hypothetical protein